MALSKIEWTRWTWNPWWGCREIAAECGRHAPNGEKGACYAAVFAGRGLHRHFLGVAAKGKWTGLILPANEKVWSAPYGWKQPDRVFTCSMSDFWFEDVPLEWLDRALTIIQETPHLSYQILTKRPGNIVRKLADLKRTLPKNVWLGVTCGHQSSLPLLKPLRRLEASVKFLSVEPLLTPMVPGLDLTDIQWAIAGGQSGRDAAICDPDWMRAVRDVCLQQGVPFFLKQWGVWTSNPTPREQELDPSAKGGATLDGRLWRQFPV